MVLSGNILVVAIWMLLQLAEAKSNIHEINPRRWTDDDINAMFETVLARISATEQSNKNAEAENIRLRNENKAIKINLKNLNQTLQKALIKIGSLEQSQNAECKNIDSGSAVLRNGLTTGNGDNERFLHPPCNSQKQATLEGTKSMKASMSLLKKRLLIQPTPAPTPNVSSTSRTKIGFSVHLSGHLRNLGSHQILVFDAVDFNEGQGYDPVVGIFVCPVSGVYVFSSSILSHYQSSITAEIVLDNAVLANIYAGASSGRYSHGSNLAVTHCSINQHVWVRQHNEGNEVFGNGYSTFAGFLLWTDRE